MLTVIVRISSFLAKASTAVARVLLAFVAFVLLLQVILRYVFNAALPWPEEAARYAMIWVVLLTGCALVRDRELITVDFFDRLWPRKVIVYRDSVYRLLLLVLLWVLLKEGIAQAVHGWQNRTTALEIRWFWPYLAIPVGTGLMLLEMVFLMITDIFQKKADAER